MMDAQLETLLLEWNSQTLSPFPLPPFFQISPILLFSYTFPFNCYLPPSYTFPFNCYLPPSPLPPLLLPSPPPAYSLQPVLPSLTNNVLYLGP